MAEEDLSPDLEVLKGEIEKDAGVDEAIKDSLPTTESKEKTESEVPVDAMEKAKEVISGFADKTDGVDEEEVSNETEVSLNDVDEDSEAAGTITEEDEVAALEEPSIDFSQHDVEDIDSGHHITEEMRAEAREEYSLNQRVASMLPAEYETWLFPALGSAGFHEGQVTLGRVVNNLSSAGFNAISLGYDPVIYPKIVQIAAATWSQTNYAGGDVIDTREQLTLAPSSQVVDLLPSIDMIPHDHMSPAFPVVESVTIDIEPVATTSRYVAPALLVTATLAAILTPVFMVRRSMKTTLPTGTKL